MKKRKSLLTPKEAADLAGVSLSTVYNWLRESRAANYGSGRMYLLERKQVQALAKTVPRNRPLERLPSTQLPEHADPANYLTTAEVCAELRISRRTLYRRIQDGSIPAIRWAGRRMLFRPRDVAALMGGSDDLPS